MPDKMYHGMMVICGMNCTMCYKYLSHKRKAKKYNDETLTEHCREFKIKDCANNKNLVSYFECREYLCRWIKNFPKIISIAERRGQELDDSVNELAIFESDLVYSIISFRLIKEI